MPESPPKGSADQRRVLGHADDFDELSWHLTYRAARATEDKDLPQSAAEAKFVAQMLGEESLSHDDIPGALRFPVAERPATKKPQAWPWVLACLLVLLVGIVALQGLVGANRRYVDVTQQRPGPAPTAVPTPYIPYPPQDKSAVEVLAEMLAIAEDANPGIIWFTSTEPVLRPCLLWDGREGEVGSLSLRWNVGDYDAIESTGPDGLAEWRAIQRASDLADDAMLEAWLGESLQTVNRERFGLESMKGNWYFTYVYPGLARGTSTFGRDDGVGLLQLETQCLNKYYPPESSD